MKALTLTKETVLDRGTYDRGFAPFRVGDSVKVAVRIKEQKVQDKKGKAQKVEEKERIQYFEGDVIRIRKHGIATTFTVRKIGANSVAIERVFAWYSPLIVSVELIRRAAVRKAKLYYMRKRVGKAAQTEKIRSGGVVASAEEEQAPSSEMASAVQE